MKKFILLAGALLLLGCEQEEQKQKIDSWTITKKNLNNFYCYIDDGAAGGNSTRHYFQIDNENNIFYVWQDVTDDWYEIFDWDKKIFRLKKPKWSEGIGFTTHKVTQADRQKYTIGNKYEFLTGMDVGTSYIKGFLPANHSLKDYGDGVVLPPEKWRTTGEVVINKASMKMNMCFGGYRNRQPCSYWRYSCIIKDTEQFQGDMNRLRSRYLDAIETTKKNIKKREEDARDKF
tara:strand:+ start:70 stop:765 length:696 start_codon:yes stop_codon:yes gene_type:complete